MVADLTYGHLLRCAAAAPARGEVARQEVIVEQAEALDAVLPLDVQEAVAELERALEARVVVPEQHGADRGDGDAEANQARRSSRQPARVRSAGQPPETRTASSRNSGKTSQGGRVA